MKLKLSAIYLKILQNKIIKLKCKFEFKKKKTIPRKMNNGIGTLVNKYLQNPKKNCSFPEN